MMRCQIEAVNCLTSPPGARARAGCYPVTQVNRGLHIIVTHSVVEKRAAAARWDSCLGAGLSMQHSAKKTFGNHHFVDAS
jgi:hypothetical protein